LVEALLHLGKSVSYCNIPSDCGHDAFLLDNELEDYGSAIQGFLEKAYSKNFHFSKKSKKTSKNTSIFFQDRVDFQTIAKFIPGGSSILDLGCQDGELLEFFSARGCEAVGVELDYQQVKLGLQKGLRIIHSNLNHGLESFKNKQFQFAIVSQTLQSISNVEYLLKEIVRVAQKAIVSFPNFAFLPLREMLYFEGRAPKAEGWYDYEWYDTPNCRFPSILDFEELCKKMKIKITDKFFLNSEAKEIIIENPNRNADNAIFVISKT
jgi:homoserine O-acetyltransferase